MGIRGRIWVFVGVAVAAVWVAAALHRGPVVASEGVGVAIAGAAGAVAVLIGVGAGLILVHELGHAVPAVLLTAGRPLIEIGKPPREVRFSIGRIDINASARIAGGGICRWPVPSLTRTQIVLIAAGGPAASLALAALCGYLSLALRDDGGGWQLSLAALALTALGQGIGNLVPHRVQRQDDRGKPRIASSDGKLIIAALRKTEVTALLPLRENVHAREQRRQKPRTMQTTARTQRVLAIAAAVASACGDAYVSTGHVLHALRGDPQIAQLLSADGPAAPMPGTADEMQPLPITPALRRALGRARDSLSLGGHTAIEPEHLLLALLSDPQTLAHDLFIADGIDLAALRIRALQAVSQI